MLPQARAGAITHAPFWTSLRLPRVRASAITGIMSSTTRFRCVGGADSLENLQLQPWPEALAKDEDEINLCKAVCAGALTREEAVGILAGKWLQAPVKSAGGEGEK